MIECRDHVTQVRRLLRELRVCAILGARQVGKTTLAAQVAEGWQGGVERFDLENPRDIRRLGDPLGALDLLRGLVVLDEIPRLPDLFPVLRVLADRKRRATRFLVLGSAAPELLRQSSETLAGRIAFLRLAPLRSSEGGAENSERLWVRGGCPRSYLASSEPAMRIAQEDLRLDRLLVIHPGEGSYLLAPRIRAVSLEDVETEIRSLRQGVLLVARALDDHRESMLENVRLHLEIMEAWGKRGEMAVGQGEVS